MAAAQLNAVDLNYESRVALGFSHQQRYFYQSPASPADSRRVGSGSSTTPQSSGTCEAAAYYYASTARRSEYFFHLPGNQPLSERQRLSPETEYTVDQGERGVDDAQIEYQRFQAEQGV